MDSKRSSPPAMTMLRLSRGKLESSMCLTRQAVICATTAPPANGIGGILRARTIRTLNGGQEFAGEIFWGLAGLSLRHRTEKMPTTQ
jgi:hypothetical protein